MGHSFMKDNAAPAYIIIHYEDLGAYRSINLFPGYR